MTPLRRLLTALYNSAFPRELFAVYLFFWMAATTRRPLGTNIYDREWDVLVLLDACRFDALLSVANEYDFLNPMTIDLIGSPGSTSMEWMLKTFTEAYRADIERTRYLSTNGHLGQFAGASTPYLSFSQVNETRVANADWVDRVLRGPLAERMAVAESDFAAVEHLYHLSERNPYGHTPLPDDVTDRAIQAGREHDPDRLIIHYMQPHAPYLKGAIDRGYIEDYESSPFEALRNGIPFNLVWDAYIENLRLVLDSVSRLLRNLDADTVAITADHGDCFGELGFLYSHPAGVPHPDLKGVPWVETTARDTGTYEPDVRDEGESVVDEDEEMEAHVKKQLEELGYL